jgi:Gas vesicle protein
MTDVIQGETATALELGRSSSDDTRPIALVDLLDRLLGTGVVLAGDVVISLAGVDLVELRLRALLRTVDGQDRP